MNFIGHILRGDLAYENCVRG